MKSSKIEVDIVSDTYILILKIAIYIVRLISHSVKKMLFNSVFVFSEKKILLHSVFASVKVICC